MTVNQVKTIRALGNTVLVADMSFDMRTLSSGIVLLNDDGKSSGIRPRWGQVYAVGPQHQDVRPGQWILVAHGRWTRGVKIADDSGEKTIRKIDPDDILMVSDDAPPPDETMSTAVVVSERSR